MAASLKKVDGVVSADVSAEKKEAVVAYDSRKVKVDDLVRTIRGTGFKPGAPRLIPAPRT